MKLAKTESSWKGSNKATVNYDCNLIYKVNGRITKTEKILPGSVIDAPAQPTLADGETYYLMVNGKILYKDGIYYYYKMLIPNLEFLFVESEQTPNYFSEICLVNQTFCYKNNFYLY